MEFKQIQELIKLINKNNLSEFKLEQGDFKISIRTDKFNDPKLAGKSTIQQVLPIQSSTPAFNPSSVVIPQDKAAEESTNSESTGSSAETESAKDDESRYVYVKSPIVGTFYRSSSPDKEVYVKVGDVISQGTVVCIVEAMKLFNEIESEVSGKIIKVLAEDASPVEYDQALFLVDPKG